jgi:competence protein ComEC
MPQHTARGRWITPLLAGAVLGPALQLQQPALWSWQPYAGCVAAGLALLGWRVVRAQVVVVLIAAALLGFGACGWRAAGFIAQGLDPAFEGRDLAVVGVIAAMPQVNEAGVRFRFEVESAAASDGSAVRLPPLLSLGWYGGPLPMGSELLELQTGPVPLHAGERWRFAVRLKAPHGTVNPHGFDYELWL